MNKSLTISDSINKDTLKKIGGKKYLAEISNKVSSSGNIETHARIILQEYIKRKLIKVSNLGDHRICMSSAVLSLVTSCPVYVKGFETVNTSSPSFLKTVKALGGKFEIKKAS